MHNIGRSGPARPPRSTAPTTAGPRGRSRTGSRPPRWSCRSSPGTDVTRRVATALLATPDGALWAGVGFSGGASNPARGGMMRIARTAGATWSRADAGFRDATGRGYQLNQLALSRTGVLYAATERGLWRTTTAVVAGEAAPAEAPGDRRVGASEPGVGSRRGGPVAGRGGRGARGRGRCARSRGRGRARRGGGGGRARRAGRDGRRGRRACTSSGRRSARRRRRRGSSWPGRRSAPAGSARRPVTRASRSA